MPARGLRLAALLVCFMLSTDMCLSHSVFHKALARFSLGLAILPTLPLQSLAATEMPNINYIMTKEYLAEGEDLKREEGDEKKMSTRSLFIRASEKVLTNKVLENFRKADQLERDEAMLLDDNNYVQQTSKVLLLYPIIEIQNDLGTIKSNLNAVLDDASNRGRGKALVEKSLTVIRLDKYETKSFKRIFNRYSDNILYTNTAEANIYLLGGTTPNSLQTEQYLYRNSALTSVNFIKEDLGELQKMLSDSSIDEAGIRQEVEDAIEDCDDSLSALDSYLKRADPVDLKMAKEIFTKKNEQ